MQGSWSWLPPGVSWGCPKTWEHDPCPRQSPRARGAGALASALTPLRSGLPGVVQVPPMEQILSPSGQLGRQMAPATTESFYAEKARCPRVGREAASGGCV